MGWVPGAEVYGAEASVLGLCLVTWPLRSCRGTDSVSMSPVFSATYALEVLCGKQVSRSHSIYLSVQAACAMCCPGSDLKLLVPQGPGHLSSETIGPSSVPSPGPVSSLYFRSLTLPKTSLSLSLSMVPSCCAVDTHAVLGKLGKARVCGLCKYELTCVMLIQDFSDWCMLNGNLKSKDPVTNSKDDLCCMRNHTIVILYYTCLSIK